METNIKHAITLNEFVSMCEARGIAWRVAMENEKIHAAVLQDDHNLVSELLDSEF